MTPMTPVFITFDPTTGARFAGFGGTVAVVTPDQVWDVTPDENAEIGTNVAGAAEGVAMPWGTTRGGTGAGARFIQVAPAPGNTAWRLSCVDATGALASATSTVQFRVDRISAN